MAASLSQRCTNCNQRFQPAAGTCAVCGRSDAWEPCVVETVTTGILPIFLHPTGVAFFAYEEAAKAGRPAPAWAAATIPAGSAYANEATLESRIASAIATNSTYLALASPSTAQNTAQIKALTQQIQALLRIRQGQLGSVN